MRYIPIRFVREGMTLAKPVFGANGSLLLSAGAKLSKIGLNTLIDMKYNGVYIKDELSCGTEMQNLISDHLKSLSVQALKQMYTGVSTNNRNRFDEKYIKDIISCIVNEISDNRNVIINLIDLKVYDDYTYYHSVSCTTLVLIIGMDLGLSKDELYELGLSAILHDMGKLFIPIEILNKKEKLTDVEYEMIKQHSMLGYNFLQEKTNIPDAVCLAVLQHHEKYNGVDGYPFGIRGDEISLYGRILAVADVYDALTSDRSYRKAMRPSDAMEYLMGNCGIMFDPKIVRAFCHKISPYPIEICVQLCNGEVGIVRENYECSGLRPKVELIDF